MALYYVFMDDEVYGPFDYGYLKDLHLPEYNGVFICNDRDEEWYEAKKFSFDADDVAAIKSDSGYEIDEFGQIIMKRPKTQLTVSVPQGYHIDEYGQVIRDTPSSSSSSSSNSGSSHTDSNGCSWWLWILIIAAIILFLVLRN
jgi:hypothetical protein